MPESVYGQSRSTRMPRGINPLAGNYLADGDARGRVSVGGQPIFLLRTYRRIYCGRVVERSSAEEQSGGAPAIRDGRAAL